MAVLHCWSDGTTVYDPNLLFIHFVYLKLFVYTCKRVRSNHSQWS